LQKKIPFWSDRAERISGYARIDVLGHSCAENILLHRNQQSCEMCIGTCPVATALHSVKPAAESLLLRARGGGLKGNRATESSRAVAAAGNNVPKKQCNVRELSQLSNMFAIIVVVVVFGCVVAGYPMEHGNLRS